MKLKEKELTNAVSAMMLLSDAITNRSGLKIVHPTQKFTDAKWEAAICGLFASLSEFPDAVLPEHMVVL